MNDLRTLNRTEGLAWCWLQGVCWQGLAVRMRVCMPQTHFPKA